MELSRAVVQRVDKTIDIVGNIVETWAGTTDEIRAVVAKACPDLAFELDELVEVRAK